MQVRARLYGRGASKAGPDPFARDDFATGSHRDTDLGGVECGGLARLIVRPHTLWRKRLSVPAVVPEDAVRLGYDVPPLDVAEVFPWLTRVFTCRYLSLAISELRCLSVNAITSSLR